MASFTACSTTVSSVARVALVHNGSVSRPSSVLGLPAMNKNMGKMRCSMERKPEGQESESKLGMCGSLMAAACAASMSISPAAMALVDERMSTEGTGLPFGLSNNLLGWILFGVFGLIWSLYTVYTSSLDEDDDSGLSL
ncbi:photosystem II reaction center W protein, chloroplastic-like [Lycium barbarum]|uniref:photosystem II reaction center W protein, chloroplastic-like n=1 Tax=Lycium barbarum TaxID=112863 RepID=UPI00293F5D52|nr:photosystem II reaction center W protein, chloroplastic-like [Lycium barbarum]